jgi:hypothetical protein
MASGPDKDVRVIAIRAGLIKARNWWIVLPGSLVVLAGAVVELVS